MCYQSICRLAQHIKFDVPRLNPSWLDIIAAARARADTYRAGSRCRLRSFGERSAGSGADSPLASNAARALSDNATRADLYSDFRRYNLRCLCQGRASRY